MSPPVTAPTAGSRRPTLTGRGRIFVAVGFVSLVAGLILGVTDLQRAGVLMLALPVPAWFAVRGSRSGVRVGHSVSPNRIEAGERAEVRLHLANPAALGTGPLKITESVPGGRTLRFSVGGVRGHQRRTVAYPLPELGRGRYRIGPATLQAGDPFGLATARSTSTDSTELLVRPRTEVLAGLRLPLAWRDGAATLSHSVGVGGSDDASVREYRHGDDLRKIHWRSTARAGALMMRQEERPWHGESLVLLDTRVTAYPHAAHAETADGNTGSAAFEWAVTAAASIGRHFAERNRKITVVTGDGDVVRNDASAILDLLAESRPARRFDSEPLAQALQSLGRDASAIAVISGNDPSGLVDLLARSRAPGSSMALLIKTWTFADGDADTRDEQRRDEQFDEIADRLTAAGWAVVPASADDTLPELWARLLSPTARAR